MRKQDYLPQLIRSLTSSEKRYFKLYTGLQPGTKNYLKLFDLLESEHKYDSAQIARKLKITPKKLADEKEYLQQVLLKALRNFEQDANPQTTIVHRYLEASMLNKRGMQEMALSILDKAFEKAIHYEQHGTFINCYRLRLNLVQNRPDPSPEYVSPELFRQQIRQMEELIHYEQLYYQVIPKLISNEKEKVEEVFRRELPLPGMEDISGAMARVFANLTQTTVESLYHGPGTNPLHHARQLLDLFKKEPKLKEMMPQVYVLAYMNIASCLPPDQADKAIELLDNAVAIIDDKEVQLYHKTADRMRFQILVHKLNLLDHLRLHREVVELAEKMLKQDLPVYIQFHLETVRFRYASALLYTGHPADAQEALREVLKGNKFDQWDIQVNAMMLEIMIQYDLKNYMLIPYLVTSIRKWINRNKITPKGVEHYLKWMLRIGEAAGVRKQQSELKAFLDDINAGKIETDEASNIKYWLEDKLKHKQK